MLAGLLGCAPEQHQREASLDEEELRQELSTLSLPARPGRYYRVRKDDSLWRIAVTYGTTIEQLVRANDIANPHGIEVGQLIFIPSTVKIAPRPPPYPEKPVVPAASEGRFAWPLRGPALATYGSRRHHRIDHGLTIAGEDGAPVLATKSGVVCFCSEQLRGFGKVVIIDHGREWSSLYAHNSQILVKVGDRVKQGTTIARVGRTGRASRAQLHFRIYRDGSPVDPRRHLP